MQADVKEVHIQDLATVLEGAFSSGVIGDVYRRFEVPEDVPRPSEVSLLESLRALADTRRFEPVLAHLLDRGHWSDAQVAEFEAALEGSPLSVRVSSDGDLELFRQIRGVADRSMPSRRERLEEMVPSVVETQINAAEQYLGSGEYDMAAAEIRRGMDMLVVGGYDEGLEELAEHDLILLGDEHEHSDATVLYVAYGYCSFLGADPEMKGFETSKLQAELAVAFGEEVIYFLLEKMAEAEAADIELTYWERP